MKQLKLNIHWESAGRKLHIKTRVDHGITAVCGPSGAGKTTLLRCLAGLEAKISGEIRIGDAVWLQGTRAIPPHKRNLGFCFQDSRILPHLTVRGNLHYAKWVHAFRRRPWRPALPAQEIIDRLKLGPLLERRGKELSGGEARRVALGRALLSAKSLLLLDEPFVGLDQDMCGVVRSLITDFHASSAIPVFIVSHRIRKVLGLTDQILLMDQGHCLACGAANSLLRRSDCIQTALRIGLPNVIHSRVRWQDPGHRQTLCQLAPSDKEQPAFRLPAFRANYTDAPEGAALRYALDPKSITVAPCPSPTAATNQLAGRIEAISENLDRPYYLVDAGFPLLVHAERNQTSWPTLKPGEAVWCHFRPNQLEKLSA